MGRERACVAAHRTEAAGWRRAHLLVARALTQNKLLVALVLALASISSSAYCDVVGAFSGAPVSKPLHPVDANDSQESAQVALLASKLEQWLACHRLNLLASQQSGAAQVRSSAAGSWLSGGCAAHFDGRLCWPESAPAEETKLACPRPSWLPGEREHSIKSVINSIQSPTTRPAPVKVDLVAVAQPPGANRTGATVPMSAARQSSGGLSDNQRAPDAPESIGAGPEMERQASELGRSQELARRLCMAKPFVPEANLMLAEAQWQTEADYSACQTQHQWINLSQNVDEQLFANLADQLERLEPGIDPYGDPDLLEQWILCIGNIMRQKPSMSMFVAESGPTQGQLGDLWCPIIFDGWRCWPETRAGQTASTGCPRNQPGFIPEREAHKICTQEGTWYRHPATNRFWSNYTTCVDTADLAFRTKILNLYVIGNLISLVALSASLIIFISFKSLNCTRVAIHKNLFLSFITNNLMWIIWYTYVVRDAGLLQSNPIECQFWHILLHYFLVSNYFWMFCEGLYLHTLLVVAFVSEDKILKWFYLLGWITPVPIIVAYAYNRAYDDYFTNFCWMEESPYNLILMAPIGISLLLNLVFLINIVRVLVTKLRANNSPDTHQTRKAVRATLILIPLLGLHYILTPFRPEAKSDWEGIYETIAAVCTSFQGLCVAMLFCFCNGEVITVIKKKLKNTFNLSHRGPANDLLRSRSNTLATTYAPSSINLNGNSCLQFSAGSDDRLNTPPMRPLQPLGVASQCPAKQMGRTSNCSSLLTTITCNSSSSPAQSATITCLSTSNESGNLFSQTPLNSLPLSSINGKISIEGSLQEEEEEETTAMIPTSCQPTPACATTTSFSVST